MEQYIPKPLHHKHNALAWNSLVQGAVVTMEMQLGSSVVDPSELMSSYYDAVQQLPLYGYTIFRVQHVGQWALPIELDVAVGRKGIQLIDPVSKDKLRWLPFTLLLHWEVATNTNAAPRLSITTLQPAGSLDDPVLVLQSVHAEDISLLLLEYNNILKENTTRVRAFADQLSDESNPQLLSFKVGTILNILGKDGQNW